MNNNEYSPAFCQNGTAILCNGQMMTIGEIVDRLQGLEKELWSCFWWEASRQGAKNEIASEYADKRIKELVGPEDV
jgi:hypothetical protein